MTVVSIHAPTRGATVPIKRYTFSLIAFQSTHPHGVRRLSCCWCAGTGGFNPRTHTGCDIYAYCAYIVDMRFQSTHPHGVRHEIRMPLNAIVGVSIHAPTRGATAILDRFDLKQSCFNPRTHTGCDYTDPVYIPQGFRQVSIHAPTRGATIWNVRKTRT